jgi:hypothetical protein
MLLNILLQNVACYPLFLSFVWLQSANRRLRSVCNPRLVLPTFVNDSFHTMYDTTKVLRQEYFATHRV